MAYELNVTNENLSFDDKDYTTLINAFFICIIFYPSIDPDTSYKIITSFPLSYYKFYTLRQQTLFKSSSNYINVAFNCTFNI